MNTLIDKINKAHKIEDVLDLANFKTEFNAIVKQIHPDTCTDAGAVEATSKMNIWKSQYENGKPFTDDAGIFKTNGYWADFSSTLPNLTTSVDNYRMFQQLQSDADIHFKNYLPKECRAFADGTYRFVFEKRAIPLSGLQLPQEHVNWVLNRLLEYIAWLSQSGFVHGGLNPESVFIVPENHGIQVVSFYHLAPKDRKIHTVSGRYMNWYPAQVLKTKTASPVTDLECAKRIASYLLGDASGNAVKFRKTHNEDFINFLLTQHDNAYQCLTQYQQLLRKNFITKFYSLTI
ncbi:MAG TPA: hypothetical protein VIM79_16705 [Niastella sp.]